MITVDIGLLWGEQIIRGELICWFDVKCWTDCNRFIDLGKTAGHFEAHLPPFQGGAGGGSDDKSKIENRKSKAVEGSENPVPTHVGSSFAIRLAECFTRESAERILALVPANVAKLGVDILEAGRVWKTEQQTYDNRVWWPVVKLPAKKHAEAVLDELRKSHDLDPLGFFLIHLPPFQGGAGGGSGSSGEEKSKIENRKSKTEEANPSFIPHPSSFFDFTLADFSAKVLRVTATPLETASVFQLYEVPIGRGFHWEHKETLEYRGALNLFAHASDLPPQLVGGQRGEKSGLGGVGLTASNTLPLETYLESAVGSEMRSDLPPAFSQAQAIAARSTVLATANRHHRADGFDLCNDDHCQCYQGVAREANAVIAPIRDSAGVILISPHSDGGIKGGSGLRVADARYAKSCGGISERYDSAWGPDNHDYMHVRACGDFPVSDLTDETAAREFVLSHPPAWCNDKLYPYPKPWDNDPLFRWQFTRTQTEWAELIESKTGKALGKLKHLRIHRRGPSGRILILGLIGSADRFLIYGELNIRRALSPSHLPSSFFIIDEVEDQITLTGAGWGHGVGLCQLGAAAMAKAGWSVEQILKHYYPESEIGHT